MTDRIAVYEAEITRIWQADPAHDMGHLRRVWRMARMIAMDEPDADTEVLLAAAYFHDTVNLPKNSPDRARASTLSADMAVQVLPGLGFPTAKLPALHHAIAAHSFSARIPCETVDAKILQDADRLEALGAIGLVRMFLVSGALGGAGFDADDPMALRRPLDDRAYALDHLQVKLFGLVDTMNTETGRAIAAERAEWMGSFRTRLLSELGA